MSNITHCVPSLGESGGGPSRSVSHLCNALYQQEHFIRMVTANDPIVPLDAEIKLTKLPRTGASFIKRLCAADFGATLTSSTQGNPASIIQQHGMWLRSSHAVTRFAHANNLPLVVASRGIRYNRLPIYLWALRLHEDAKTAASVTGGEDARPLGMRKENELYREMYFPTVSTRKRRLGVFLARSYRVLNFSYLKSIF